jgi:hypothetical protein
VDTNFPENCGAVSDEHRECFHQDISSMEKRYQGKWNCTMLANYCRILARMPLPWEYEQQAKHGGKRYFICVK